MAEYKSLKVPELKDLLQKRGLPVSGKKEELIQRLEEHDKTSTPAAATSSKPLAPPTDEDEIDWDDEPVITTATSAQAAPTVNTEARSTVESSAAGKPASANAETDNPTATTFANVAKEDAEKPPPTTTTTTTTAAEGEATSTPAEPPKSFAAGLAATSLEEELEKRRKRAAKFGLADPAPPPTTTTNGAGTAAAADDDDSKDVEAANDGADATGAEKKEVAGTSADAAAKLLARAKKFGTSTAAAGAGVVEKLDRELGGEAGQGGRGAGKGGRKRKADGAPAEETLVTGLDKPLPEGRERKRGRADEGPRGGRREGKRRFEERGGRPQQNGNGNGGARGEGRRAGGTGAGRVTDDPGERKRAEARAKRFGGTA